MNPEVKQLWIDALLSGRYEQGEGKLQDEEGAYCCLGVLCDLSKRGEWMDGGYDTEQEHFETYPPLEVRLWAGLDAFGGCTGPAFDRETLAAAIPPDQWHGCNFDSPITLDVLNDHGFTFEQIARVIEVAL